MKYPSCLGIKAVWVNGEKIEYSLFANLNLYPNLANLSFKKLSSPENLGL